MNKQKILVMAALYPLATASWVLRAFLKLATGALGALMLVLACACSSSPEPIAEQVDAVRLHDTTPMSSCDDPSSITGTYTVMYTPVGGVPDRAPESVAYVGGERTDQGAPCKVTIVNCSVTEEFGCTATPQLTTSGWVTEDDAGVFERGGPATVITGTIAFDGAAYTFRGTMN